jgi:hypothetical protein
MSFKVGDVTEKFDGKAESSDAGRYLTKDGRLTVNFPKGQERLSSALYTVEEFPRDFTLKLEFRASVNADSGIVIRKPQLQCRDSLVDGPHKNLKNDKPQDWNQIEVVIIGWRGPLHLQRRGPGGRVQAARDRPHGLEGDCGQMEYRHIQIK